VGVRTARNLRRLNEYLQSRFGASTERRVAVAKALQQEVRH
jgi:hypothetical protein